MLGNDARHTGQSNLLGPKFAGTAPGPNDVRSLTFYDKIKMFPAVGPNGDGLRRHGVAVLRHRCAERHRSRTIRSSRRSGTEPAPSPQYTPKRACWPTNADVSASGAAVDKNDNVYFGDRDNSVYKFRGTDGTACGRTATATKATSTPRPVIMTNPVDGTVTVYFAFSRTRTAMARSSR